MKILYGYPGIEGYNARKGLSDLREQQILRIANAGFDISPFCLNISDRLPIRTFQQLDKMWKRRDRHLMSLYERFYAAIESCDVFYNSVGANFHPEFVESINQFTVFGCNDDPESSEVLSKPIAYSYDMCAIGNIAEIETYKSWGIKNVEWQPMGIMFNCFNPNLTYEQILTGERDISLFMLIDKLSRPRRDRMNTLERAFPNAHFYGRGWTRGYLLQGKEVEFLQRSKIGINIHNSTGPINTRLFYLPANGVMQICDNKSQLRKIFELNKEVIGFDNIEECIDLCHYYLNHDEERRIVAANGWRRAVSDYNEVAVFQRLLNNIDKYKPLASKSVNRINLDESSFLNSLKNTILYESEIFKNNLQETISKSYRNASRMFSLKANEIFNEKGQ